MFFDENAIFEKTLDLSNVKLVPFQLSFNRIEFLASCIPLQNRIGSTVPTNVETLKKLRPTATVYHRTQHSVNENLVGNR